MSAEASEAEEARRPGQTFQANSDDDFDSESDTEASVQPSKKRRTLTTEGGGTHCAPVNNLGFKLQYDLDLDQPRGQISKATFHIDGQDPVVVERPEFGAPLTERLVWALLEKTQWRAYQNAEMRSAISKCHELLNPLHLGIGSSRTNGVAITNGGGGGGGGVANMGENEHGVPNFVWNVQKLGAHTLAAIKDKYFLKIEDGTKDAQGNLYVPNGKKGSMCGTKFPHAIINFRARRGKEADAKAQYVCGACNNVKLVVRLMKHGDGGGEPARESEILDLIKKAHLPHQRSAWFNNEDRMQLYMYLEFADGPGTGTPVSAKVFKHPPAHGKLFSPAESPPYTLGETEFPMANGCASCTTNFAQYVAHANLKKPYKDRQFRFVVKVLNPFLVDLEGFTVRSLPFVVKSVLHNDVRTDVRFIKQGDEIVQATANVEA